MVLEHEGEHASRWAAVVSISSKIGCAPQTLHEWVKKAEIDSGADHGGPWKPSNSQRSDGSTGSTIAGCWSLSATSRRSKPRNATTPGWQKPPWWRDSNKIASGNPGAVQDDKPLAVDLLTSIVQYMADSGFTRSGKLLDAQGTYIE
jgi:hypothetical protein